MSISAQVITRVLTITTNLDVLFKLSTINKQWHQLALNENDTLRYIHGTAINLYKMFKYNELVYDNFIYRRKIFKKYVDDHIEEYLKIRSIIIKRYRLPSFQYQYTAECGQIMSEPISAIDQYICEWVNMPIEYHLLLSIYQKFPSPFIRLYPAHVIADISSKQYTLMNHLLNSYYEIQNLMICIPICYSKHFRQRYSDTQYITTLCFMSPIGSATGKYMCVRLEITDMEDNGEHFSVLGKVLHDRIMETFRAEQTIHLIDNIIDQCTDFHSAMSELMNNHNFNL